MKPQTVHVVGVAGVGMSAIAQALLDQSLPVSGSDRYLDSGDRLPVLDQLERAGCRLVPQDGSGVGSGTGCVVVSTAIEAGNPDLDAAHRQGIPVVHRAAMLARLVEGARTVAVTGTAGKTTVTAMTGWLLQQLGEEPGVVNGGVVLNWDSPAHVGNARKGNGTLWVIEADESDRSLLQFRPMWAVITNVSKDHFDEAEVIELFRTFAAQVTHGIVCGPGVGALLTRSSDAGKVAWHEIDPHARVIDGAWHLTWRGEDIPVPMPGRHNAMNAALACEVVCCLGHAPAAVARALAGFRGVHRRLEIVGQAGEVRVIDDYAHNPAKILATWNAVSETASRVLGVWRPHGYRPLQHMHEELEEAFVSACRAGDTLYLLPVYYAGGTAQAEVSSVDLVGRLKERGIAAYHVETYEELEERILEASRPGDTVLVMGARDPDLSRFAHKVVARLGGS